MTHISSKYYLSWSFEGIIDGVEVNTFMTAKMAKLRRVV